MMPEARLVVRGGTVGDVSGGLWIQRRLSPTAVTSARQVWNVAAATDNKENIPPPSWAVTARRYSKLRRSPLPEWYPRTPLRDITYIVNALERKRRARASAVRPMIGHPKVTPTFQALKEQILASPLPQESGAYLTKSTGSLASDVSEAPDSSKVSSLSSIPLIEQQEQNSSANCFAVEHPSQPMLSTDLALKDLQPTECEKKLDSLIDKIEKVAKKQLKKAPLVPAKKSTRILMSMR